MENFEWAERQGINPYQWAKEIREEDDQDDGESDFSQWEQEL